MIPRLVARASVIAVALILGATSGAFAGLSSSATASASYAAGTLEAPTALAATAGSCTQLVSASVVLTWTSSTSAWASGYEVLRSLVAGGPYTSVATITGVGTTTYTDGSLLFLTTYSYVVRTTKGLWRSPLSGEVARATPSALCV